MPSLKYLLLALLVALAQLVHAGEAAPAADDPVLEKRVYKLAEELRCLVCQNQTIADSHAELAIDLKNQIREKMKAGMSDEQITQYMVARYGDFVLYRPPVKATTLPLWFGPFVVLVAAVVIATTGWLRADAVASLVIGALIVPRTLALLGESVNVLLEATPKGLDLTEVRQRLMTHPHVHDVHDLHASQVATGLPVLTAHVVVDDSCFHDGHLGPMLDELQHCLETDFDIEHSTIQFEAAAHADHEHETHA